MRVIAVLLLALLPLSLSGQYNPPTGANELDRLLSPRLLATGPFGLIDEYPSASVINPAAGAPLQRTFLDFSYLTGVDFSSGGADFGAHILNLGGSYSTPAGVVSGSLQAAFAEMDMFTVGNIGRLNAAFAKTLYDTIDVGAGVQLSTGYGDRWDGGAALSLGYIHRIEDRIGLNNARYGISIAGLGKWFRGYDALSPYPSPFTPAAEFAFSPAEGDQLKLDVYAQMSAPSFRNLRGHIGTELTIRDRLSLQTGLGLDLHEVLNNGGDVGRYLPSIGLNVRIPMALPDDSNGVVAAQGWNQSELNVRTAAAPMPGESWVFAAGVNAALGVIDRTPPRIEADVADRVYISPNNDGIQDYLEFPVEITDERYVMGYRLIVRDADGETVRLIENADQRPDSEGVRNVIDRLLEVTTGIPVPETLRWDGRTDAGARADDGEYTFQIEAWDDNNNLGSSVLRTVVVDTLPPQLTLDPPQGDARIFSPSEDSLQNTVAFGQSGSQEDLWRGVILDAQDQVVRSYEWQDSAPEDFEWDGFNNDGEIVPDGVYSYRITSRDRAGNSTEKSVANIIVNTEPTPVSITISRSIFSPNDNGIHDTIRLLPEIGNTSGIRDWSITVFDSRGAAVRTYRDVGVPRSTGILFDGRNNSGQRLPEGRYRAELVVNYRNGNRPTAFSPDFVIDVTPPAATVSAEHAIFSPNNSGVRDTQILYQETSQEEEWVGILRDRNGRTVREFVWHGTAAAQFEWDGRTSSGELARDGIYSYQLTATDRAGNTGESNIVEFELNTEETPVLVTTNYDAFSPTGQGHKDTISIIPNLAKDDDIEYFRFEILRADDQQVVRTVTGSGTLREPFVWDGRNQDGLPSADGGYTAQLEILYLNGNLEQARTDVFILDTEPPQAEIAADFLLFSPDGDGRRDEIPITQRNLTDDYWIGSIVNAAGETVIEFRWGTDLQDFTWDGRDAEGNLVADGVYKYQVRSEDEAGNRTEYSITDITVDTRPTSVFATVEYPAIAPNLEGTRAEQRINTFVNLTDGADRWELQILDADEQIVRTFSGTDVRSSASLSWDGRTEDGEIIEGRFRARFIVDYEKGNRPTARTREFLVDTTPPSADIVLDPVPFSPDNDGIDDELSIALNLEDASGIADWRFEIRDRNNRPFHIIEGSGAPGRTLTWDGRSSITGELVISAEDYPYEFTVSDVLGNTAVYTGVIPIDILVIRDGDRLKVQIPSITFAANSPELLVDPDTEVGAKNRAIVERLVEIFTRYNAYSIQVEGHAVNLTQTAREEREELQPLSLARAQSVRQALIDGGLSSNRITAVGRGGMEPIVPHTDEDERWKNRRVEFILIR
ncbi:outer membrane protein/peptidoglycan-associated (lipo)protein [Spirochaeta africana DSM 8902]|uniref:Outer membrane protein/peptidoglycan-associated (Lipo)protein n=2 Tax=Spirochaeta TaxID=146 RepID=H9UJ65_SPIAZ|nr:outer membrane protein/peptidoglycan-associated (lipo)protein [Spirochaeta africana DSM 8902]